MAKQLYKYTFDDLKDQDNNCIVTSLTQLSEKYALQCPIWNVTFF